MENKNLYAIFHGYDEDGGFGDAVWVENLTGVVWATDEEIAAYLERYDKPEVYDHPYADLTCHSLRAEKLSIAENLDQLKPYGEEDYFGVLIKQYAVREEFKEKYGDNWLFGDDREKIMPLYLEALEKAREENEQS